VTGREPSGLRIAVIGCGYLGAVHAAGLAAMGHHVVGIDRDVDKAEALARGEAPFYEPELPELLREASATGRLRFTTDMAEARGCTVLDGLGMLVNQGAIGVRHWTGVEADRTVMRRTVEEIFGV